MKPILCLILGTVAPPLPYHFYSSEHMSELHLFPIIRTEDQDGRFDYITFDTRHGADDQGECMSISLSVL